MGELTRRMLGEWRRRWQEETRLGHDELDELAQHLLESAAAHRAAGLGEAEAFERALETLGPASDVADEFAKSRPPRSRLAGVPRLVFDVRYALRQLQAHPIFTVVAVASIGVAIASNTLAFSVVNGLLLRDPGFGESERLVEVYTGDIDDPSRQSVSSWPIADDLRGFDDVFAGVAGYEPLFGRMLLDGAYVPAFGEVVDPGFFDVLEVPLAIGRGFTEEDARDRAAVAVLSYDLWRSRFEGRGDVLGAVVEVNGEQLMVVGVAPDGFRGAIPALVGQIWVPRWVLPLGRRTNPEGSPLPEDDRERWSTQLKARLQAGVTAEDAEAVLISRAPDLARAYPESYSDVRFRVIPTDDVTLSPAMDGVAFSLAGGVMGVVAVVLMIASMNLAGFLLARGADRRDELRLRRALGATRTRLVGQLFTESIILAALGGALGLGLCYGALEAFARIRLPIPILLDFDFSIDRSVLLFTLAATLTAALLFGLLPAWQSTDGRGQQGLGLAMGTRVSGTTRTRAALLAAQVAVSLVFLVWGGLFTRSLLAEAGVDIGFRSRDAAVVTLELASSGYGGDELPAFLDRVRSEAGRRSELGAVAFTTRVPLGTVTFTTEVRLPEGSADESDTELVQSFSVSPEYFDVMNVPLVQGRLIGPSDRRESLQVVVVSRSFVERYRTGGASVGAVVDVDGTPREIVGMVEDVRVDRPGEGQVPHLYLPLAQQQGAFLLSVVGVGTRSSEDALAALRSTLEAIDPTIIAWTSSTIEEHLSLALLGPRVAAGLLVASAVLALLLTVVGVFGTVSYAASRRAREMAIRLSLGATPESVTRLVVASTLRMIGVGATVGLVLSLAGSGLIRGMLYGVGPFDPWAFLLAATLLGATAGLAAVLPARHAGRSELAALLKDA